MYLTQNLSVNVYLGPIANFLFFMVGLYICYKAMHCLMLINYILKLLVYPWIYHSKIR